MIHGFIDLKNALVLVGAGENLGALKVGHNEQSSIIYYNLEKKKQDGIPARCIGPSAFLLKMKHILVCVTTWCNKP